MYRRHELRTRFHAVDSSSLDHRSSEVRRQRPTGSPIGAIDSRPCKPRINVHGIESNVLADLVERDAAFADEATDEALGRAEAFGELGDTKHRPGMPLLVSFGGLEHVVLLGGLTSNYDTPPRRRSLRPRFAARFLIAIACAESTYAMSAISLSPSPQRCVGVSSTGSTPHDEVTAAWADPRRLD